MIELIHRVWPTASQWQMLLATFGFYVCQVLVFGIWYYILYKAKPERFLIASNIVLWQVRNVSGQTERSMSVLTKEIEAMDEVRTALASGAIVDFPATLPSGRTVATHTYAMQSGYGDAQDRLCLKVSDASGVMVCNVEGPQDEKPNRDYFIRWLDEMLHVWRSRMESRRAYLTELSEDPARSFNLLDFVYFSGVTQTTVGFGDMLPN